MDAVPNEHEELIARGPIDVERLPDGTTAFVRKISGVCTPITHAGQLCMPLGENPDQ